MPEDKVHGGELDSFGFAGQLRSAYAQYADEIKEIMTPKNQGARINTWLFKNHTLKNSGCNQKLIDQTRAVIDEMVSQLEEDKTNERVSAAEETARFMLLEAPHPYMQMVKNLRTRTDKANNSIYWMFVAMQTLCMPLLPYLSISCLQEIYDAFGRQYPNKQALPNQKKILEQMRALIQDA